MNFSLDSRLAADTFSVGDLALSRVLLMNDARYPWLILVPRRLGAVEIIDLERDARLRLMDEIVLASEALKGLGGVEKLNVGALGNNVRQLHVHVIGRKRDDFAGLGPVWGVGTAIKYEAARAQALAATFRAALKI